MIQRKTTILLLAALPVLFSCNSENSETENIEFTLPDSGITIEDAWARPGRANGVTAVYLHVLNGSAETDTLISLSSPQAGLTELHETFERGEGMMGMREAEEPWFPGRSVTTMQPGGLHIMLMQLNTELLEGDEVEVNLTFAIAGEVKVTAPVREPASR
jgi:periplasmic copper chaperone A